MDAYEECFIPLNMLSCKDYDLKTTEPDSVVTNISATDVSSFILGLGSNREKPLDSRQTVILCSYSYCDVFS